MSYSPIFQPIIDTTTTTTDAPGPTTKSGPPRPGGLPNGTSNTQALVYIYPTVLALAGLLAAVYAFRIYGTRRRRAAARLAAMEDALRRLGPVLPPPEKPIWHAAYLTPAWESQNAQSSWNDIKPVSVTISWAETPSLSPSPSSPPAPVIPSPFYIPAIFKKARRQRQRGDPEQQVEDTVAANITTRENSADDRLITSVMIAMPCQRGGGKDSELDWDDDILPEVLFGSEDVRWRADTKLSGNP